MTHMVGKKDLADQILCDSAGTAGYHSGEPADARMIEHGKGRGYELTSLSRKLYPDNDFEAFDYIVTMGKANYRDVSAQASPGELDGKLFHMCSFSQSIDVDEVPDPYYGGAAGFERVFDILEDACANLLLTLEKDLDSSLRSE